ncbi:unnamed protein product [Schistosoma curassoni]|uniref:Uncharacterized protein n=1 Tax=Schistosoma curassoni TaxID=6186 RepID=A0A183JY28_9TREM|nr:unnamed protein product [Schistosoma curassoni]
MKRRCRCTKLSVFKGPTKTPSKARSLSDGSGSVLNSEAAIRS